jgi:hypothetical protein
MTSNEDWVVPAGMNERRFCVLDVDPRCEQNYEYFREIDEELAHGGLEYLLADLLAFDRHREFAANSADPSAAEAEDSFVGVGSSG